MRMTQVNKTFWILALAPALAIAGQAPADPPASPAPGTKERVEDPEAVVCHMRRETGSQRIKRICTSVRERDEARQAARREMQNNELRCLRAECREFVLRGQ